MGLYHDGYHEALKKVDGMTEAECLDVLDALHGRDDLEPGDGIEDLRAEVRRQYRREFRDDDDGRWGLIDCMFRIHGRLEAITRKED